MIVTAGGTPGLIFVGYEGNQGLAGCGFSSAEPVILRYPEMSPWRHAKVNRPWFNRFGV
jgi:hypothetical protein